MNFHYVRRFKLVGGQAIDLGIVDIPENDVAFTLKNNPLWIDLGPVNQEPEAITENTEKPIDLECPLCGFKAKNEKSLRMHKMKAHK